MALCSVETQCHAVQQPKINPAIMSASVHGWRPGKRASSQSPTAAPSRVGTAIDHPISPIMPRPNQTPVPALRCALIRRFACLSPWLANMSLSVDGAWVGSPQLQARKTKDAAGHKTGHNGTGGRILPVARLDALKPSATGLR